VFVSLVFSQNRTDGRKPQGALLMHMSIANAFRSRLPAVSRSVAFRFPRMYRKRCHRSAFTKNRHVPDPRQTATIGEMALRIFSNFDHPALSETVFD